MKRPDALITTQKNRTHFDEAFWKKNSHDLQKGQTKIDPFYSFSWFFPKWYLKQSKFLHHCTQWIKTLHISLQTPYEHKQFWKKSGKTTIRVQFFGTFLTVKSYFFKNGLSKWILFFCVAISASRRFIWAIKRHYPMIFNFHFSKGGPFWFRGGLSATPRGLTGQKRFSKCFSGTL